MREKGIGNYLVNFIKNNIKTFIITLVLIIGFVIFSICNELFNTKEIYTVVNGYVEKFVDTSACVIKKETIVPLQKDSVVPVIEQGKRVGVDQQIAVYRTESYDNYLEKIDEMDKQIQTLVNDLPPTYSADIESIEEQISKLSKEAIGQTSYIKMQEYKSKIDELTYRKIVLLGELSPDGSKIRELIDNRKKFEEESKSSQDNIKATVSGIVSYRIDDLESIANIDNILNYTYSDLDNIFEKYSKNNTNKFGIKIIDNFKAYLVIKEEHSENDEYIQEGRSYNIKITDKNSESISCKLVKYINTEECNYCIFEINNIIEDLIDNRTVGIEVIWRRVDGLAVPKNAIEYNEEKKYNFVTVINGDQELVVPIDIVISSDSVCIIETMSDENKKALNLEDNKNTIELYDQILIKDKNKK